MNLQAYITDVAPGEGVSLFAPFPDTYLIEKRQITEGELILDDGRTISADQRRKIYATLRDISLYTGDTAEYLKDFFKAEYVAETGGEWFSLKDVDVTTANMFLELLIEWCIRWDIPCQGNMIDRSPDVSRYLYRCLVYKRCAICGGKAELHHVDAVGAGRNRKEILHLGMRALPLCRNHHIEIHAMGRDSFFDKYHVYGIRLDEELCGAWKLKVA